MAISPDALLDILHKTPSAGSCPTPRVLGIDDFAFRKGQRYGTILVDLEKNCPVDVLPDRDAKSVEHWLKQHPGVEIVSRDRAEIYRNGVTAGAPNAIQVADRFHLLANLRQALQDSLIPFRKQFLRTTPIVNSASSNSSNGSTRGSPQIRGLTTRQQRLQAERRQKRHNIWERIQSLRNSGYTQLQIAREVGVSVKTVRRLFQGNAYPERKARTRSVNDLTLFLPYIQEQWNAERRCIATLYREVQDQGFTGSYGAVNGAICRLKKNMALYPDAISSASVPVRSPLYSVRQMTWLFLRSVDEGALPAEQLRDLEATLSSDSSLPELRDLAHMLVRLIRQRDVPALGTLISAASGSSFGEMKRLSSGLVSDLAAVRASLEQEWSNGQVEGQVNRLKFVKRSMYGRGSFDLLKARVLHQNKAVA
jgi:transposase